MTIENPPAVASAASLEAMRGVVKTMIELHRALLAEAMRRHEQTAQIRLEPLQKLHLATTDPEFAWLRPISELIVEIDEYLEEPRLDPSEVEAIRTEIETLTGEPTRADLETESEDATSAGARIRALVDASIPVAVAFVELERALALVPREAAPTNGGRGPAWRQRPRTPRRAR